MALRIRKQSLHDRAPLDALIGRIDEFSDAEKEVARELVVSAFHTPGGDYRVLVALEGDSLVGYLCYGPTPMTQSTYDLYWVAADPLHRRKGIAKQLVRAFEDSVVAAGGGLLRVEASSIPGDQLRFYLALGYAQAARFTDFYRPGDDLVVFTRRV